MNLRDQLQNIYVAHGRLTPSIVVAMARDERHPLHSRFEWNDVIAGEKYRESQAAALIRSVRISFVDASEEDEQVRAFHAIQQPDGNTYRPIEEIAEDPFARELLLRTAEREWRAMRKRYAHLQEFMDLIRRDVAEAS